MGKYAVKKKKTNPLRGVAVIAVAIVVLLGMVWVSRPAPVDQEDPPAAETVPASPYSAADFVYDGAYMTCTAGETRLGVDVSGHQQEVDWDAVAGAGFEFAFVRIGYRGYTQGLLNVDEYAARNLTGAKEAGLLVGAYFFSQAISVEEALAEAAFCIDFLREYRLDLPVVFDWEYVSADARTGSMDRQTLTACALAFCQAVEDAGFDAMIYFNPNIQEHYYDLTQLTGYPFWLALYSDNMSYPYAVELWQYTDSGSVPGISGKADINLWFID